MITLGGRAFAGPFLAPLWSPPRGAGLFAVMIPDPLCGPYRAIHIGQTSEFSSRELLRGHADYARWLALSGGPWNLYVASHPMPLSTEVQRQSEVLSIRKGHSNAEL